MHQIITRTNDQAGTQVTDNIVTRLRAEGEMEPVGDGTKEWQSNEICQEAADYIEELVAEYKALRMQYGYLETQCSYWREVALQND